MAAGIGSRRSSRGFTLVELVITLVLLSALAVVVVPRLGGISDFQARGFHDETLALLRHAQKSAIAQRRTVCVLFTASGARLRLDADRNAGTGTGGCEADLAGPRGETPASITARGSVQYSTTPGGLSFDALGRPSTGLSIQVAGASRQVTVEAVTGFVHE